MKRVVIVLNMLRSHFIKWPTPDECVATAARIEEATFFRGVIGSVDGTHIVIAAPKEDHESYINRKGRHSLQLQVSLLIVIQNNHKKCY